MRQVALILPLQTLNPELPIELNIERDCRYITVKYRVAPVDARSLSH